MTKSFYDALPNLPDIAEASRPDVVSIIQGMCDFAVFDSLTLDPTVEQGIVESILHINHQGTEDVPPMLQMVPLSFAEPTTAADNQYVPLLQGNDHIGQLSPMPPSSTINMPTVPHNFTKEFSCGTQTAPAFPTVLNLQQVYASSANHHGVSAQCRL